MFAKSKIVLRKILLRIIIPSMVYLGLWLNMPMLSAIAWRLGLSRRKTIRSSSITGRKLVILTKAGGIEDIEAAYSENFSEYPIFVMERRIFMLTFSHFLGKNKSKITDMNYYTSDSDVESAKKAYQKHLLAVLKVFDAFFSVGAFLQFNILYYAERELAFVCSKIGIPFVSVYKENLKSEAAWKQMSNVFRISARRFYGWKIAVYNENARRCLIDSGVSKPWQVIVTGCARMDYSHKIRNNIAMNHQYGVESPKSYILYYLSVPHQSLPFVIDENVIIGKGIVNEQGVLVNWGDMIDLVNGVVIKIANDYPDLNIIVKTKLGFTNKQIEKFGNNIPKNLKIVKDGTGHHLLKFASVVIGFNSTTVLEAVAAGVPTIVPHIFTRELMRIAPYAHEVCNAVFCINTTEKLEKNIVKFAKQNTRYPKLNESQKNVLDHFMRNSDGRAGRRLKKFIDEAMQVAREEVLKSNSHDDNPL